MGIRDKKYRSLQQTIMANPHLMTLYYVGQQKKKVQLLAVLSYVKPKLYLSVLYLIFDQISILL